MPLSPGRFDVEAGCASLKPYRSLLFVPGHKPDWIPKAIAAGADALILDLEDSVPDNLKAETRQTVAESIARTREENERVGIFVRPNSWESGLAGFDLEAVIVPGLTGLFLPKIYGPADIRRFETLVDYFEVRNGVEPGSICFIATLETAESIVACEEIARSSPRVATLAGITAKSGDVARGVGYQWTPEGLETLYLRSRVVLACRAAGLDHPLGGLWQNISDIDGLRAHARFNRQLGFRGEILIHPSHVAPVNEIYTPSAEEIEYYRGMIEAFEAAVAQGHAAIDYEGEHVDYAHVKTAQEWLRMVEALEGGGDG